MTKHSNPTATPAVDPLSAAATRWLHEQLGECKPKLLFADASFRSYYRIKLAQPWMDSTSLVLMHAPPDKESLTHFVAVARHWRERGVHAPEIKSINSELGLALLEDFGEHHLSTAPPQEITAWYSLALYQLQAIRQVQQGDLPDFCRDQLPLEMQLLPVWGRHHGIVVDNQGWQALCTRLHAELLAMPQVTTHRDFHSRNLMRLGTNPAQGTIGVLDFQDACIAPVGYDLASLVFDAYIQLPQELVQRLIDHQAKALVMDSKDLTRQLNLVGLQRLLKVYGIFCRLAVRDHKRSYLACLPRISAYMVQITAALVEGGDNWVGQHQPLMAKLTTHASEIQTSRCEP